MSKKLLVVVLVAIVLSSLLSGCVDLCDGMGSAEKIAACKNNAAALNQTAENVKEGSKVVATLQAPAPTAVPAPKKNDSTALVVSMLALSLMSRIKRFVLSIKHSIVYKWAFYVTGNEPSPCSIFFCVDCPFKQYCKPVVLSIVLAIVIMLSPSTAYAQVPTDTLNGTVTACKGIPIGTCKTFNVSSLNQLPDGWLEHHDFMTLAHSFGY